MKRLVTAGVALWVCSGVAFAQTSAPPAHPVMKANGGSISPCGDQSEKVCGKVEPGAGRRLTCMNNHLSQLTPACHTFIHNMFTYETALAARNHMTMSQYMEWGQNFASQAEEEHLAFPVKPAAPATPPAGGQDQK